MRYYTDVASLPVGNALSPWLENLPCYIESLLAKNRNGHLPGWQSLLKGLPEIQSSHVTLVSEEVSIGRQDECEDRQAKELCSKLLALAPWRKGPFSLFGINIDSEWRSDLKWDRLKNHVAPLRGRTVLDVGCGNGYYCLRMVGEGAGLVIGIDPVLRFFIQFLAVRHFIPDTPVYMLPVGIDELPRELKDFDTVFSMGVLYHRRSPIDHILKLRSLLREGGELVLETLVVEGGATDVLVPGQRYAKMNNVWFIPSPSALEIWLGRCGFRDIRLVDITRTTPEEQRKTQWMSFESLADFLNPENSDETIEGLPAPRRAIFLARN